MALKRPKGWYTLRYTSTVEWCHAIWVASTLVKVLETSGRSPFAIGAPYTPYQEGNQLKQRAQCGHPTQHAVLGAAGSVNGT